MSKYTDEQKVQVYDELIDIYDEVVDARDYAEKVYKESWKKIGPIIYKLGGSIYFKMSEMGRQAAEHWAKRAGNSEFMREHFTGPNSEDYLRELRYTEGDFLVSRGVYWAYAKIESIKADSEGNVTIVMCDRSGIRLEKKPEEVFANMCPSNPIMFNAFIVRYIFAE